jgi:hypothetical protein
MKYTPSSFVTSALLRLVESHEPALAGDLQEEREAGRSSRWFWVQLTAAAIRIAWRRPHTRPTVVRLVTMSEFDRPDRTPVLLDPATINLSGTKVRSIGGLGLLAIIGLMTAVLPEAWWLVVTGVLGGTVLGVILVRRRRRVGLSGPQDGHPIALFDTLRGDTTPATPARVPGIYAERFVTA